VREPRVSSASNFPVPRGPRECRYRGISKVGDRIIGADRISPAPGTGFVGPVTAVDAAPARTGAGRLYALDLLRFCAALAVLGYHFLADTKGAWGPSGPPFADAARAFRYGWMGVEFFFVISGFVICMSCWGRSLGDFFTSRVTRLVPAYLFSVLATGVLLLALPLPGGRPPLSNILVNTTMLQQFLGVPNLVNVYWTLLVELKFYLLFAVVVYVGLNYRRAVLFCSLWTVLYLIAGATRFTPMTEVLQPGYAPFFMVGIGLYLIHRFGSTLLAWSIVALSMVLSVPALLDQVAAQNNGRPAPIVSPQVALTILLCFFAVMVAAALGKLAWMRWRWLTSLGALTYPLYLLHMQLAQVAVTHLHVWVPRQLLMVLVFVGVLLGAYLVHRFVERPLSRLLRRQLRASFARIREVDAQ